MSVRLHGNFGNWLLAEGETVLGRGSECGLRIDDPRLSRRHATFTLRGHQFAVGDLGSTNGVLVDGQRINGRRDLRHGEVVVCGPVVLMVTIDQTAPHPRQVQGGQDPTTRRTAPRTDTETMAAITAADRPLPSSSSRGIDPGIAAAISGSHDPARQSALQPVEQPGSMTSPLSAIRPDPGQSSPPRRSSTTTSSLEAAQLDPAATGALEAPRELPPVRARLLAGCADGLLAGLAVLPALPLAMLGTAIALHRAGVGLDGGRLRLAPGAPAGIPDLAAAIASPAGLDRVAELVPVVAVDPVVRAVLAATAGLAALTVVLGLMLVLVHPTVVRGAPPAHRRQGIRLARSRQGTPLGWGRAMLRWALALLLWPLALPTLAAGRRSPHDVLSGCIPLRTR